MIGHQQDTQEITLGNGCQYRGTIAHEIMHLLGFYHEHTRQDRDQYITVYDENILDGMFPGSGLPNIKDREACRVLLLLCILNVSFIEKQHDEMLLVIHHRSIQPHKNTTNCDRVKLIIRLQRLTSLHVVSLARYMLLN